MKNPNHLAGLVLTGLLASGLPLAGNATLLFDADVTPDIIFGSGNANGDFTVDRNNGVELGLRGKIPFVGTTNSNGDGTYRYDVGTIWNFDWTVNVNFDQSSLFSNLGQLTYTLGLDTDPGNGTSFFTIDPINVSWADHSFGDNSTGNGDGAEAPFLDTGTYATLVTTSTVVQQSWRYQFFPISYSLDVPGTYDIFLEASSTTGQQARTQIQVIVGTVPEPATLALMVLGLAGVGMSRRRKA